MAETEYRQAPWVRATIRGIGRVSLWLAALAIVALLVLMLTEATLRYFFSAPLGWNVSFIERVLLPASLFLALPWLYVASGHVSAELLYDRLPAALQKGARWVTLILVIGVSVVLLVGGMRGVIDSYTLGLAPLPGSAEVPLPTWTWQLIQPVGALGVIIVALLDAPRFLRFDELHMEVVS